MTDALFHGIGVERLSDRVYKEVAAAVREGRLQPGQRLPAERHLADQFGISRVVVREALRSLAATGWVDVRPGRGAFVAARPGSTFQHAWSGWLRQHRDELVELLAVRRALEEVAARLAAENARPAELEALRANCDAFAAEAAREIPDTERLVELDLAFHHLVAVATHGVIFDKLVDELAAVLVESRRALFFIKGRPRASADDHRRILEAIAAGDTDGAAAAMADHMGAVVELIRAL